jgi:hypothetical protein
MHYDPGRSALLTEHTTSAVLPVLTGRSSVARLLRLLGLVLANVADGCPVRVGRGFTRAHARRRGADLRQLDVLEAEGAR